MSFNLQGNGGGGSIKKGRHAKHQPPKKPKPRPGKTKQDVKKKTMREKKEKKNRGQQKKKRGGQKKPVKERADRKNNNKMNKAAAKQNFAFRNLLRHRRNAVKPKPPGKETKKLLADRYKPHKGHTYSPEEVRKIMDELRKGGIASTTQGGKWHIEENGSNGPAIVIPLNQVTSAKKKGPTKKGPTKKGSTKDGATKDGPTKKRPTKKGPHGTTKKRPHGTTKKKPHGTTKKRPHGTTKKRPHGTTKRPPKGSTKKSNNQRAGEGSGMVSKHILKTH